MTTRTHALNGWDIGRFDAVDWAPWGSAGNARAKVLATGDGYWLAMVESDAGYEGDPHEHRHAEFLYVLSGHVRTQGREMRAGDAYIAAAGSTHSDFATPDGARYLSIFRL